MQLIKSKPSQFKRLGLSLACIGGSLAIASGSAQAFSFSDIGGIVENFAPFVDQTLGIDISPYVDKIANSAGFADAVLSGNWGKASKIVSGALGEYGVISPKKLQVAMEQAAKVKYSTTGKLEDFGLGEYGAVLGEQMSTKDVAGSIQSEINMGEDAQKAWVKKGEALAQTVKASSSFASGAAKETNSLNVLKSQSAQLAANTAATAQAVSEIKAGNRSLFMIQDTLNDIRTANNAEERSKLRGLNDSSAAATSRAGTFAGFASSTGGNK